MTMGSTFHLNRCSTKARLSKVLHIGIGPLAIRILNTAYARLVRALAAKPNLVMTATSQSTMEFTVLMKLTEGEARALDALVSYGHKAFLEVFYEKLGRHYMQPYEKDLISLFDSIHSNIPKHLQKIDKARKVFEQ